MSMLTAMTANQCVGLESAHTNRFLADTPGSVAFSTPYRSTLLIRFWWGQRLSLWCSAFTLSGIDFESEIKQVGHDCPFVSIFFPDVSAGHWELLWNVDFTMATWQQKHLLGLGGKHWIPLHPVWEHTRQDDSMMFNVLHTNLILDSSLLIGVDAWIATGW